MTESVFHHIPDFFIERYLEEINAWAANYRKIGNEKTIVLKEGQFADVSPAEDQGPVLLGVKLIAEYERVRDRMNIRPKTERDKDIIRNHCRKMEGLGIKSRLYFKEPARPGIPIFPTVNPTKVN